MAHDIDLGTRYEALVGQLLASGRFGSREDILREGVRLLSEREAKLARLDAAIERGIADADAGRVHDIDEVRAEMRKRYGVVADVG